MKIRVSENSSPLSLTHVDDLGNILVTLTCRHPSILIDEILVLAEFVTLLLCQQGVFRL